MDTPVRYQPAAVIVISAPSALTARLVSAAFRRTLEHVPVEIRRRSLSRLGRHGISARKFQDSVRHIAQQSILNQLRGLFEMCALALLQASLNHAIVAARSLHHLPRRIDRVR